MKKILLILYFILFTLISSCSKTESLYSKYSELSYLEIGDFMDGQVYDLLVPVDINASSVYRYKVYDYQSDFTCWTIMQTYECKYFTDGDVSENILTGIYFNMDSPYTIDMLESISGRDIYAYRQGDKYSIVNYFLNPDKETSSFVLIEQYLPMMVSNENKEHIILVPINVNIYLLKNNNIYNFIEDLEPFEDVIEEYDFFEIE